MRRFLGHYISHVPIGIQGRIWKTVVQLRDASSWRHGHTNLNLFLNRERATSFGSPPSKVPTPDNFLPVVAFLEFAPVKASSCIRPVLSEERQVLLLVSLLLLARAWLNEHGGAWLNDWAWLNEHGWLTACVGFLYC